ncbi:spore germination protein GerPE [Siminovitchia sp. FSL H7-0308]|uniref:spore germination protein GerPE n=1 Tax=Siminovitchia sp. FSL H7-0308 TaxID=2921432 RepID=UPI0030EDE425
MIGTRNSVVQYLDIKNLIFGSILEIGDSVHLGANANALAVQRRRQLFYADEGDLLSFSAFTKPIPLPPIYESFPIRHKIHDSPNIRVGNVHVIAASNAAVLYIGSTNHIAMEGRVKHIRQINPRI